MNLNTGPVFIHSSKPPSSTSSQSLFIIKSWTRKISGSCSGSVVSIFLSVLPLWRCVVSCPPICPHCWGACSWGAQVRCGARGFSTGHHFSPHLITQPRSFNRWATANTRREHHMPYQSHGKKNKKSLLSIHSNMLQPGIPAANPIAWSETKTRGLIRT